jgi:flagellar FliL protein
MSEEATAAKAGAAAAGSEKPGKSPVLMMAAGSLIMVGAAWAGVHFALKPMLRPAKVEAHAEVQAEQAAAKGEIIRFENIVVNPSGTMGSRYLSTTVGLEVSDEAGKQAVERSEPMIKDALITHLSSRTIDELTDPAAREQMRVAIRDMVNAVIAPQKVSAVFFLDFVLQ